MRQMCLAGIAILVSYSFAFGQIKKSNKEVDSLLVLFEKVRYNYPDSALDYASTLEGLFLLEENGHSLADLYRDIGIIFKNKGEFGRSIEFHQKSVQIFKSLGDSAGVAANYNNLGNTYKYIGHREKSLDYYLKSAMLREKYSKPSEYATVLYNIGNYYGNELGELGKGEEYYMKAKEILETVNDPSGLADLYYNLGLLNNKLLNYDKAIEFYERSMALYKQLNYEHLFPLIWNNIGAVHSKRGDYATAKIYYLRAYDGYKVYDSKYNFCFNLIGLANLESKLGNYEKALEYAQELEGVSTEITALKHNVNAQEIFYQIYHRRGDYKKSLFYSDRFHLLRDSLTNIEKNQTIQELTIRYETELKEKEIEKLSNEKEMKEKEVMLATTEKNAYLVAIFFAAALALASIGFFNQRHKATQLSSEKALEQRNKQIDVLLQEQEISSLNAMLEGQEQERIRIAEELHDRLGSLLSAIKLNFNGWIGKKDLSAEEIAEYSSKTSGLLDEAVTEVRRISHNLSSGQISKFGLLKSMEDLADTVNRSNGLSMKVMHFNLDKRLPVELETTIYRIVQEMLANVLKHSRATEFTVQLSRTDESVILTGEDNGIGFDQADAMNKGGMGLQNIEKRARKQKGQFSVDTAPGQGTIFTFEFPLTS